MNQQSFQLDKPFIELHALLKLLAIASSGGAAKIMIAAGEVRVDGQVETRKACKIRGGQVVRVADEEVQVVSADRPV
ncbi:MAG: RNA-binding S4 domain-containing protein [Rhodocyclaceae bacterium]|nr:RNA-binding S4 domain-containing protein [Rhodocyclaceae bacterium]MDZ4213629.1 RNA-binding S4 domain-containing protein [Rhodocyclaceae bacterium]